MLPIKQLVPKSKGPLPLVRFLLYALAAFLSLGLLALALATLITQLMKTVGYNKVCLAFTCALKNADDCPTACTSRAYSRTSYLPFR